MASDTKDRASNQKNYSEKNTNALNENNQMQDSGPGENDKGIDVPEDFQKSVHALTSKATKAHLGHMRNKINEREDELRDEEMKSKGKNGKFSMEEAPSSIGD
jgi:hypothetical protein